MSSLPRHLEQITLSAKSIGEQEFPPSRPFTNALLHNQEITALIRDTEPHERGLFSVDQDFRNGQGTARSYGTETTARWKTMQNASQIHSSAVARLLGTDMLKQIQSSNRESGRGKRVDLEILLQGAEKLCAAFDMPGVLDRIVTIRARHEQISVSIARLEDKVTRQQSSLGRWNAGVEDADDQENTVAFTNIVLQAYTEQDFRAEQDVVKVLEARKKELEERIAGMERDLGGLRG